MKILVALIMLISSLLAEAQIQSFRDSSYSIQHSQNKKWFFSSYSGVGLSFNFYNGNTATVVSAPIGLQLNRQLNNNLYAFAGVTLVPTYTNFGRSFLSPGIGKSYAGNSFKSDYLGLNSSVNLGLMYINDARTFSVSGSIGVERSNYPMLLYPPLNNTQSVNTFRPVYR